jgi:hypothetical protein
MHAAGSRPGRRREVRSRRCPVGRAMLTALRGLRKQRTRVASGKKSRVFGRFARPLKTKEVQGVLGEKAFKAADPASPTGRRAYVGSAP